MNINRITSITVISPVPISTMAQEPLDTVQAHQLHEVVVEAKNQRLGAEVSTYIPTSKQKNSAQTAVDLLNRMAIPQIIISPSNAITDLAGKDVDVFIDFLTASKEDMDGMRMQDVKKVEYYDFPTDPRFLGKAHVVNFVMQKYEYGGYVKAYGWENTANAGQVSVYGKLQYKRMTFDIAAGASYVNQDHAGVDTYETFRLPQADGTVSAFERTFLQGDGSSKDRTYWPTFKALYASDKITLRNVIGASFDHTPYAHSSGIVAYNPAVTASTNYDQWSKDRVNSLSYSGYWNFILDEKNTLTFSPAYSYSHTNTSSSYSETNIGEYFNAAKDDSHRIKADLIYTYTFGKWGNLNTMLQTIITTNNTTYTGSTNTSDDAHTYRVGPGVQYSLSKRRIYWMAGFGYHWDRQEYLGHKENSAAPWIDFSLQYSPNDRQSVRGEFHHMKSIPSSSYRSAAVIQSNLLMSYTGNPYLVSYGSYDAGLNYSFILNNKFSFSSFATTWIVSNRYVYDYQPTETGILRAIKQPGGAYSQWWYGVYAALRLFDRKLQITTQLKATSVRNGEPYNLNKIQPICVLQVAYCLGCWTFSGLYNSPQGYPDGCMGGTWVKTKALYRLEAGWSNSVWNLQLQLQNFARWHWRSTLNVMHSQYYDKIEQTRSSSNHALARLSATYTFSFGKKVQRGNEASQQAGVDSGILK